MTIPLVPRLSVTTLAVVCAVFILTAGVTVPSLSAPTQTTVKEVSLKPSDPNSGTQMYIDYCAGSTAMAMAPRRRL